MPSFTTDERCRSEWIDMECHHIVVESDLAWPASIQRFASKYTV